MAHRAKHRQAAAMRRFARLGEGIKQVKRKQPAQRQPPGTGSPELPVSRFLRGGVK
jgi:hypothetical protein